MKHTYSQALGVVGRVLDKQSLVSREKLNSKIEFKHLHSDLLCHSSAYSVPWANKVGRDGLDSAYGILH